LLEDRVYDTDGIIMTTTDMFNDGEITRYLEPICEGISGNVSDIGENMTIARKLLAAKAKRMNANAIVGLRIGVSRSSWTTGEFSGTTYHGTGGTYVAYGTPVIVRFDERHEVNNRVNGDGRLETFLSREEINGLLARRTIMEGLKGERVIEEKSIWKLLCKYPSGEYKDLIVEFCKKKKNLDYMSLIEYLRRLIPIDKDAAIEIAHSLPAAIYDDPANEEWSICLEICELGLFKAQRVCGLMEKGEIISAVRLVEAYTKTGFNGGVINTGIVKSLFHLSQMLNTEIDGRIADLKKELKDIEENRERYIKEQQEKINAEKDYHEAERLRREYWEYKKKAENERMNDEKLLVQYKKCKEVVKEYDGEIAFLKSCLKEKELKTSGVE